MNYASLQSRWGGPLQPRNAGDEDEEAPLTGGRPTLTVAPDESVYAAILFLPAISRLKTNGKREMNREARLAVFLVALNAILQMGVVRVVQTYDYNARLEQAQKLLPQNMIGDPDSRGDELQKVEKRTTGAAKRGQERLHKQFLMPHERSELEAVYDLLPLCRFNSNGTAFTCAPNSVKFVYEWDNLDSNGDGIWTVKEAQADMNNLKGKYHVSPETIFNNIINGLRLSRSKSEMHSNGSFYLIQGIENEQYIPKAYFQYWAGDAMMCSLFDPNSCEAAAKDGVFENALKPGRHSSHAKGIYDLDSAIQYCYDMLEDGGGCETLLPTDFRRNREQRWDRCGGRTLVEGGAYTNPYDPDQRVHVLKASYESVDAYARATSRTFKFFLALVIMLWLLSLLDEWREILKFGEFLIMFPALNRGEIGGEIVDADGNPNNGEEGMSYKITGLSTRHRAMLIIVYVVRVIVCSVLTKFGTEFLLVENDYLDLVMNSLALTFILTIDSMLFSLVENDVKDCMAQCKKLEFETNLPTKGCVAYCLKKECWGLFLVPFVSVCIVLYFNMRTKEPVLNALTCACLQEGGDCMESMRYKEGWWLNYWSKILPSAVHQIEALRLREQQGGVIYASPY